MFFQIIALLILLVFYGCYFFKLFSQKRKGIQTNQLGKGKIGVVKAIEVSLKLVSIALPIAELLAIIINNSPFHVSLRITGSVLGVIGTIIFILSILEMKDSWRAGIPEKRETELVTTGIYRFSRNPAFLGFDLVYLGILVMFFSWWLCLLTAAAVLLFHYQIVNVEEDFMLAAFGDDYKSYRKRVCRYFGRKN